MGTIKSKMITQGKFTEARILIVDDQKLHYLYLEKILKDAGCKIVECVTNHLKSVEVTHDFLPDILILDLIMPGLDGFKIMKQLADYREKYYLPILVLSEDNSSETRIKALQSGATDFLSKPYENIEIVNRIRNMAEMRFLHMRLENQNKTLEATVQKRTQELRETQLDIIQRLAQAAEFRDGTTGDHIIRIGLYCAALGKEVGLSDKDCELLRHASPLHDVGKIGIPDSILLKPGKLTVKEFEVMKTHTNIGGQLLSVSSSPVMKLAREIVANHHENFDGTGYPRHIKGYKIPLAARICTICDVFDALTSERPYKKAWPVDKAVNEMLMEKGTHFDPDLLDKFVKILPKIKSIKNKTTNENFMD
jgi:putative two-component system response regulator